MVIFIALIQYLSNIGENIKLRLSKEEKNAKYAIKRYFGNQEI